MVSFACCNCCCINWYGSVMSSCRVAPSTSTGSTQCCQCDSLTTLHARCSRLYLRTVKQTFMDLANAILLNMLNEFLNNRSEKNTAYFQDIMAHVLQNTDFILVTIILRNEMMKKSSTDKHRLLLNNLLCKV